ncbi:MAG: response regulator [Candidatus Marinimicrobia bacterium]|nr:response regulator [Candidatus Neomarinimicrobiota bacterium]
MRESIFIGLIQNIAVLLLFSMIYDYVWVRNKQMHTVPGRLLAGLMIGLIGFFLMYTPWVLGPGLVFDTRTILLSISGFFFGAVPTLVAMAITGAYRAYMGGSGIWMGLGTILSSGLIGILWGKYFPLKKIRKPLFNLFFLGLTVHLIMLLCVMLLPEGSRLMTLRTIFLPLLLLYTPGTALLGLIMLKRHTLMEMQKEKDESEKKYRILVQNADNAIVVAQDGFIRFANPKTLEIFEKSAEEIRDRPFREMIHPEDRERLMARHWDNMKRKPLKDSFYSYRVLAGPEKEIKWFEQNTVQIDWEGKPATLNFINDVTHIRETERQLMLAKEKAEESDRLKSIFLSNMSHEIRTPMNAIMGFADLLGNEGISPEKKKHFTAMIRNSGGRLMHIINDIIDISKLEAKQLSIIAQHCKVYDIYNQSLETFRNNPLLKEKPGVEVKGFFPPEYRDLIVETDHHRLQQVIDNLLENALKYTDKGYIELGCSIAETGGDLRMTVQVKDTGAGIPEEKKAIIFERFRQAEEDRFHEGAGLGLSISQGIVELLGGQIGFESERGRGSTFHFTLPLKRAEKEDVKEIYTGTCKLDLSGKYVVIAEDDIASFFLIREFLKDTEAEIIHAPDGEALMQTLKERDPDLVLLDINLPKKDGYECLEEIKEGGYKTKVIAQTAYALEDEKEHCLNAGCQGYVSKPIDPGVLFEEIGKVLS